MQLLDSFSAKHIGKSYILTIDGFRRNDETMVFQFDTGASATLIGLNSIVDDGKEERKELLKGIIMDEIKAKNVLPYNPKAKTVTNEEVEIFPCVINDVSIMGTAPRTLYFHIYLGDVSMPLLGFDFIDDCTFHHSKNGDMEILAVPDDAGKAYYTGSVIDFNAVLERLQ